MRTIVHLSDLHFGRTNPALLEPLTRAVHAARPDLVAISGDVTQRARGSEFQAARAFLDSLPGPQIVVPGNHDVPLHNLVHRFLEPLTLYRQYISDDLQPFFADEEMAVAGVNTARSLTWKGGRINADQVLAVFQRLCILDPHVIRIVVTHHPFDPPARGTNQVVGRAPMAMARFAHCGADVFLAGHLHASCSGTTAARYRIAGYAALVVQAGTATSTRGRGEENSFNIIRLNYPRIDVERRDWTGEEFAPASCESFVRASDGWRPA